MLPLDNTSAYPDLVIRSQEPEDYIGLQQLYAQPRAHYGTMQMPFPPQLRWKERTTNPLPGSHVLVAELDEVIVGHCGMFPNELRRRHTGHLGMAVHDDYAGKGVGRMLMAAVLEIADNWLNLMRVELSVYVDNEPAISLYKSFGFVEEGRFIKYAFRDGEYVDAFTMARLR